MTSLFNPQYLFVHLRTFTKQRFICTLVFAALAGPSLSFADDITYGYDAVGRLVSVTVAGTTAYYDYDVAGNIIAIRR